jgi:peptide/nickel transport system permease protein
LLKDPKLKGFIDLLQKTKYCLTFTALYMTENLSPNQKALRRLMRNKPALFGLGIIIVAVLMAILGYTISPDDTPDANQQSLTVALKDPGFKVKVLKMKKNRAIETRSFFGKMLFGSENEFDIIPINQYDIKGDSIIVEKYAGEDPTNGKLLRGLSQRHHLADVLYAINGSNSKIEKINNQFIFHDLNNEKITINTVDAKNPDASGKELSQQVENQIVTKHFYLGTDNFGRDILSRLILGVRISLLVGLIAVIISLTIGILLGALAGYFGGRIDDAIMLVINTVWSIPTILLVFAIVLAFGKSIGIIFLAVGLTMWVDVARLVRGQVMSLKQIQFVEAAQSMGFGTWRILSRHILPNILGPVMVVAASNFATAILIESGLSYLGFGIQPPTPSWGTMLNENYGYAIGGKPFLALIPAVAIMLMVLAFNLVGNGFRDALDVKSRE